MIRARFVEGTPISAQIRIAAQEFSRTCSAKLVSAIRLKDESSAFGVDGDVQGYSTGANICARSFVPPNGGLAVAEFLDLARGEQIREFISPNEFAVWLIDGNYLSVADVVPIIDGD